MWSDDLADSVVLEIINDDSLHLAYIIEEEGVQYRVVRSMYDKMKVTASLVVSDAEPIVVLIFTLQQGWLDSEVVLAEIRKERVNQRAKLN